MCRVDVAASAAFAAIMGILQGCALSVVLDNGLMMVWTRVVLDHVGPERASEERLVLSVVIDDRNMTATNQDMLDEVLEVGEEFGYCINGKLNTMKCQIYFTGGTVHDRLPLEGCRDTDEVMGARLRAAGAGRPSDVHGG